MPHMTDKADNRKYPTAAEIKRAVSACERTGMKVGAIEISRTGTIKVVGVDMPVPPASNDFDEWERRGEL